MTTIYTAKITEAGQAVVKQQVLDICGRGWDSYQQEFAELEERAAELAAHRLTSMITCEISGRLTMSGHPEFIRLDPAMFTIETANEE